MKYEKIYIKSKDDLPKEGGDYIVRFNECKDYGGMEECFKWPDKSNGKYWINVVDWYLRPLTEQESTDLKKQVTDLLYEVYTLQGTLDFDAWVKERVDRLNFAGSSQPSDVSDVQNFMSEVHEWADNTFGTERTALAPLYHLKKEVDEAIETMQTHNQWLTVEELADCFILILNSSSKYGLSFQDLFTASKEKMDKNRLRTWGKPDENGVCEHIKSGQIKPTIKGEKEPSVILVYDNAKRLDYADFARWFSPYVRNLNIYQLPRK